MIRVVKRPDVRCAEIIAAARALFESQGYAATSVDEIVGKAGVAKGTFYYYFHSKEDVLAALARQLVAEMAERSRSIAEDPSMDAVTKLCTIIREQRVIEEAGGSVVEDLHRPENRELHQRSNVETVSVLGPILAAVVEQGCREGVFHVDDPLSTIQFILAGSLFLFGIGVFNWTKEEEEARTRAMLTLIERALGARNDTLAPILLDVLRR